VTPESAQRDTVPFADTFIVSHPAMVGPRRISAASHFPSRFFGPPHCQNGGGTLGKTTIPAGFREFDERQNVKTLGNSPTGPPSCGGSPALNEQVEARQYVCQQGTRLSPAILPIRGIFGLAPLEFRVTMPSHPVNSEDAAVNAEDPMRDAVALAQRVELRGTANPDTIVAGFRSDGRLLMYFGEDPYYQFDAQGRLRRALVDGRLFRTQGSGLASLTRATSPDATVLLRHDLDSDELAKFLRAMLTQVGALRKGLATGALEIARQVPADAPIVERLVKCLEVILSAAGALAPAINRMR
jgi:hypothetical protein